MKDLIIKIKNKEDRLAVESDDIWRVRCFDCLTMYKAVEGKTVFITQIKGNFLLGKPYEKTKFECPVCGSDLMVRAQV